MNKDAVAEMSQQYQIEAAENLVPEGYKQTEVGVIPEDWEVKSLGTLVDIRSGESPSKFTFQSAGIPYFKVEQLNNDSVYADETPYFIENVKFIPAGSVIFPKRGASILLNKIRVLKKNSFMDTNLMTLTCHEQLDEIYLYNQLTYKGLDSVADTTSIPQINNKHIIPYLIPFPTKEEQFVIANALSDTDALLSELEKLIVKKQAIKTATMQQLLTGRTRLPQFANHPDGSKKGYKQSELGEIPEDWEVMDFDDVAARINTKKNQISTSDYQNYGSYPVVDQGKKKIVGYSDLECKVFKVSDAGVIVFGDHTCIVKYIGFSFLVGADGVQVISGREGCNTRFLSYVMSFFPVEPTGYNRHYGALKESIYSFPKQDEQAAIATILSDMDEEIQALEHRLTKTRQIKQGDW